MFYFVLFEVNEGVRSSSIIFWAWLEVQPQLKRFRLFGVEQVSEWGPFSSCGVPQLVKQFCICNQSLSNLKKKKG